MRVIVQRKGGQHGPHAQDVWRVNVVMMNQQEFAQDFRCGDGAKLNPGPGGRCQVW